MTNCPNDCHKAKNQFLVAGGGGWMVDTRGYKYAVAVGEGLCYPVFEEAGSGGDLW